MSEDKVKTELISDFNTHINTINRLPLHPKNKLNIITRYVYSKVRWRFSINKLGETWVKQNLDSIVKEYVKRWLHLPQNANMSHLYLPTKYLGLTFSLPSDTYACCQLSTRNILGTSQNLEIRELYKFTKHKFIKEDAIANRTNKDKLSDRIAKENIEKILGDINGLNEQNVILQAITQSCSCNALINWQKVYDDFPENIPRIHSESTYIHKPNNTNLLRWKKLTPHFVLYAKRIIKRNYICQTIVQQP